MCVNRGGPDETVVVDLGRMMRMIRRRNVEEFRIRLVGGRYDVCRSAETRLAKLAGLSVPLHGKGFVRSSQRHKQELADHGLGGVSARGGHLAANRARWR